MMMMMKPLREHLSPFSWIQPHSKGASFTSYHIPVFKCSPSMMRGWMPKYSLPGRRKKGRGRGEKLERESQSPSFFPFLPILCPFRRLLLRLKYKTGTELVQLINDILLPIVVADNLPGHSSSPAGKSLIYSSCFFFLTWVRAYHLCHSTRRPNFVPQRILA